MARTAGRSIDSKRVAETKWDWVQSSVMGIRQNTLEGSLCAHGKKQLEEAPVSRGFTNSKWDWLQSNVMGMLRDTSDGLIFAHGKNNWKKHR